MRCKQARAERHNNEHVNRLQMPQEKAGQHRKSQRGGRGRQAQYPGPSRKLEAAGEQHFGQPLVRRPTGSLHGVRKDVDRGNRAVFEDPPAGGHMPVGVGVGEKLRAAGQRDESRRRNQKRP